ncbi:MAG: leucine zipper domain-containing protein [Stenotrophomonas sp.]
MDQHRHARSSPRRRALLIDRSGVQGLRVEEAAHAACVSVRTANKGLPSLRGRISAGAGATVVGRGGWKPDPRKVGRTAVTTHPERQI